MWTQGKFVTGLGMLALVLVLACGLISVILFAKAKEVTESAAKRPLTGTDELNESENTKAFLSEAVPQKPAFSVAERTTELLFAGKEGGAKDDATKG